MPRHYFLSLTATVLFAFCRGDNVCNIAPLLVPASPKNFVNKVAKESKECKLIHFVRHAEGFHNEAERKAGSTDVLLFSESQNEFVDARLTPKGIEQCFALRRKIEKGNYQFAVRSVETAAPNNSHVLDTDIVVSSTLSRAIQTARYSIPWTPEGFSVGKEPPILGTDLGRERIVDFMCENRRSLSALRADFPFVSFVYGTPDKDTMFENKEDGDDYSLARQRARDLLTWFLFELDEEKITFVGHKEFFKLMFDDHFEGFNDGQIVLKPGIAAEYGKEKFNWNVEFANTEIQSAYLCPAHVFGGEEAQRSCKGIISDDDLAEQLYDTAVEKESTGPIFSKESPGKWKGKENSHAPVAEYDKMSKSLTISVPHGMSKEHLIEFIFFKRSFAPMPEESAIIAMVKQFQHEDYPATLKVDLVDGDREGAIIPYAFCNKHGLWRGETLYL